MCVCRHFNLPDHFCGISWGRKYVLGEAQGKSNQNWNEKLKNRPLPGRGQFFEETRRKLCRSPFEKYVQQSMKGQASGAEISPHTPIEHLGRKGAGPDVCNSSREPVVSTLAGCSSASKLAACVSIQGNRLMTAMPKSFPDNLDWSVRPQQYQLVQVLPLRFGEGVFDAEKKRRDFVDQKRKRGHLKELSKAARAERLQAIAERAKRRRVFKEEYHSKVQMARKQNRLDRQLRTQKVFKRKHKSDYMLQQKLLYVLKHINNFVLRGKGCARMFEIDCLCA